MSLVKKIDCRGAAEKTFTFTKPQEEFRKIDDDSIGISNVDIFLPS
jgi:hypothetical protein